MFDLVGVRIALHLATGKKNEKLEED